MKIVIVATCLLAAVIPAHGMADPDEVVAKYMSYLMPSMQPCIQEFKISADKIQNMKQLAELDPKLLGCLKACVMKRLGIMTAGAEFHMEPVYDMIKQVHDGNTDEIQEVTKIADSCRLEINGLTDECAIGNVFTDCCINKLFG